MITKHKYYLIAWRAGFSSGHMFSIRKESNWCFVLTVHVNPDPGDGW
jgi:hypothetical protein